MENKSEKDIAFYVPTSKFGNFHCGNCDYTLRDDDIYCPHYITEIISLLDELRGRTCRGNDWYRKYYEQIQYDGGIHDVHEGVFTIDGDGETDDITFSDSEEVSEYVVTLHNNYEALRKAALDGERYRKAGEELANGLKEMDTVRTEIFRNFFTETDWRIERDRLLQTYRQAVEQKEV